MITWQNFPSLNFRVNNLTVSVCEQIMRPSAQLPCSKDYRKMIKTLFFHDDRLKHYKKGEWIEESNLCRPGQALRVPEVEVPRFQDSRHMKVVR